MKDKMSNSVDPDETAHYEPVHLNLRCLQKPIIIACGSEGINSEYHLYMIFAFFFTGEELNKSCQKTTQLAGKG